MAFKIIPWRDSADFKQSVRLDDRIFILRARWNTQYEFWSLDIYDANESALLLGQKLVFNTDLLERYTNPLLPQGRLFLIDSGSESRRIERIGRNDIGVNANLVYEEQ